MNSDIALAARSPARATLRADMGADLDIRREILRNVVLCQALEPLGLKPGCTTRLEDATPGTKLEYFTVAAANSCWHFYDLADRVLAAGRQPDCIFDLAYEAQRASMRNRLGGKVNYGPIQLLVPVVAAQALDYLEHGTHDDIERFLGRTGEVLRQTTARDVECLEEFVQLGYELSAAHHRRHGRDQPVPRALLRARFATVWEAAQDAQHIHAVREMIQGYPNSQRVYRFLLHNVESGVLAASDLVYRILLPELGRPDVVADLITVGLYLVLTRHPDAILFT